VQRPRDIAAQATPTTRPTEYLWTLTADQVVGLRLEDRANGRALELVTDASGLWSLVEPGPQPADQTAVTSAVANLAVLTINSTLTSTTDLMPFGVLSPTYQVVVTMADGSKLSAAIGDKAPTGSTYYVLRADEATVVTVNSYGLDSLIGLLDNPPIPQPTATPEGTPAAETTPFDITPDAVASATPPN